MPVSITRCSGGKIAHGENRLSKSLITSLLGLVINTVKMDTGNITDEMEVSPDIPEIIK